MDKTKEILAKTENAYYLSQFDNPSNPLIHVRTTGPELWNQTEGAIDALVAGVGTGGTISGAGKFLKEKNPSIHIAAVEPEESAVISGCPKGAHSIQGIGAGLIPDNLDRDIYDDVLKVSSKQALEMARRMAREEGLLVGISAGAAVAASLELAKRPEMKDKLVVCVIPSTGERYLSTELFQTLRREAEAMTFEP